MADPAIIEIPIAKSLLNEMNLDLDGLIGVVRYADAERALTSSHDTPGFGQAVVYHKAGRALRDRYCIRHWEVDNSDNHTAIKHNTKPLRVVPCNFDENTANLAIQPRNRTIKGEVMKSRTMCNATDSLFAPEDLPIRSVDGRITWVLGIYSFDDQPLRAELCLPIAFSGKRITNLSKRIIVLDGTEKPEQERKGEDPVDVVDIKIEPRRG